MGEVTLGCDATCTCGEGFKPPVIEGPIVAIYLLNTEECFFPKKSLLIGILARGVVFFNVNEGKNFVSSETADKCGTN